MVTFNIEFDGNVILTELNFFGLLFIKDLSVSLFVKVGYLLLLTWIRFEYLHSVSLFGPS